MRSPVRLLPPTRRTVRVLIVAFLVAVICWYLGADAWYSLMLGGVITTLWVIARIGGDLDVGDTSWGSDGWNKRHGSRSDVATLSWSLRGSYGRVGGQAMWRVQRLARQRLAQHHLDLLNPADRRQIEQLIGRRAYAILLRGHRRPPLLRSMLYCLDVLDTLDPIRPESPLSRSRRRTWSFSRRRPRSNRER